MENAELPRFELRNAGYGPDPLAFSHLSEVADFGILLFLRDYHCPKCKQQVQRVAKEAAEIQRRDCAVIPILPEPYERAADWAEAYNLPFPLLADPSGEVGDAYDQPTRFGALGRLHDFIGRMPKALTLDMRGEPTIIQSHEGSTPTDRPEIGSLLERVDEFREEFVFDCELVDC